MGRWGEPKTLTGGYTQWECSGGLFLALPWTVGKTPDFFVRIIGKAKQGYSSKQYAKPSQAENDPK
ncbi:MAG TPA: hypothetical protein VNZ47_09150 [Candidatus Dormibacteraeota bacterium]|nr:hypothetical protein [Candidatus Dormibacteraeota bacterium]